MSTSDYPQEDFPVFESSREMRPYSPEIHVQNLLKNSRALRDASIHLSPETLFHLLSQYSRNIVFTLNESLEIVYVSPNLYAQLGYTPEEIAGQSFTTLLSFEQQDSSDHTLLDAPHLHFTSKSGTRRCCTTQTFRLTDGYLLLCQDVSEAERLSLEIKTLVSIARDINALHDVSELRERLTPHLKPVIEFDLLFISLFDGDRLNFISYSPGKGKEFSLVKGQAHVKQLWDMLEGAGVWVENDWLNPMAPDPYAPGQVRAFINTPLRIEGQTIGVLHIDSYTPRLWTEDEIRLAQLVSEQVSAVVHGNKLLQESSEHEAALSQSLALLKAIQEASADGICLVSTNGELVSFNQRFAQLWKISPKQAEELITCGTVMAYVLEQLAAPDEFILKVGELYDHPTYSVRDEIALRDGRMFERYSAPAISPDGRNFGRIWTFSDISDRKHYERKLAYQAFHDSLTGLPNRALFSDRLAQALARRRRDLEKRNGEGVRENNLAVLFLDLDRFKIINDSLGHEIGDELLIQVANRLKSCLRPGDTAARFGGDEFVVLLEDFAPDENVALIAEKVAQRIVNSMSTPFCLADQDINVTTSIGIVSSTGEDMPDDLLRKADLAMYRAKNRGRAQYQIFNANLSSEALARLQLELELNSAIKYGELEVLYEPVIELPTKKLSGFAAVIQWNHAKRGVLPAVEFLPVAEETGQILAIDSYLLRVACSCAHEWNCKLPTHTQTPLSISVRISTRHLTTGQAAEEIRRILNETQLPPALLVIEFAESSLNGQMDNIAGQLQELRDLGIVLTLSNFGTGCSSLAELDALPLDIMKLDSVFMPKLESNGAIVNAVTLLGQALNLSMAAEGVENEAQYEHLLKLGYRQAQGKLFSSPLSVANIDEMLKG